MYRKMLKNREILILGHKGMLGQMAVEYFSRQNHDVRIISQRFDNQNKNEFTEEIKKYPNAIILNCIGKIKQKTDDSNQLIWANILLPLELKNSLHSTQTLIQPSTDCIFDGNTNEPYSKDFSSNAKDDYGWSKYLGELALSDRKNTAIIRVSIIGLDKSENAAGLLAWFLSNKSKSKLNGFTNHFWNGITTLEWCKQVEKLLSENDFSEKNCQLFQLGTEESYTKYEMLELFQDIFETDFEISKTETSQKIDRRLIPETISQNLKKQLEEMKNFFE